MPVCNGSDRGGIRPRTTSPRRESGLTSLGCSVTREPWPTDTGRQADMSAAEMPAGAAPDRTPDWHSISWKKVWRTVRRLQARIVKAVAEGRWNKVKALVYLLTHSFGGRALAILRVVSNSGAMLGKWLKAGFLEKHAYFATTEGTPQGGCISPALANW